jgi:hypothetical protein
MKEHFMIGGFRTQISAENLISWNSQICVQLDYSVAQRPHMYPPVAPKSPFFAFLGDFLSSSDPIFILYYAMPYANLHTRFQKNPSMFPECRPNTNLLRFHASWNVNIV